MPKPKRLGRPRLYNGKTVQIPVQIPAKWRRKLARIGHRLMREAGEPNPRENVALAVRNALKSTYDDLDD